MKFQKYLSIGFISTAMLLLGSCNQLEDIPTPDNDLIGEDDGMVDVTISFAVEDLANYATRALTREDESGDETTSNTPTNALEDIDLLVYAVRDTNDVVLKQYGKGIVNAELKTRPALEGYDESGDNAQTLRSVQWKKITGGNETNQTYSRYVMSDTITLRVMRGTIFKLSCWAQNSGHKAYDFKNLTNVQVKYSEMVSKEENNEEESKKVTFDAFCGTSKFSVGQDTTNVTITLTRPFAQINVGVNDEAKDGALTLGEGGYQYSKIELDGVYTSFNVVENKVDAKPEVKESVTIGYSTGDDDATFKTQVWETGDSEPKTHTYKSLGSWFVLVPETSYEYGEDGEIKDDANTGGNEENSEVEGGILSPSVKAPTLILKSFSLAKTKDEEGPGVITYTPIDEEGNPLPISVKRNWRTNILFEDWKWATPNSQ